MSNACTGSNPIRGQFFPSFLLTASDAGKAVYISGVGSNRVLQGPLIQVVGVALITEFCDHNYSFVEVIL